MTNEAIAKLIQEGNNDELIPLLWDKVKNLLYANARKFYAKYEPRFKACDVELQDIKQECYFVMLQAVKGYKSEQGHKFNSYLKYPLISAIYALLGNRTSKIEPLNICDSLDKEIQLEGDIFTLYDTLKDNAVDIEDSSCNSIGDTQAGLMLWQEVDTLPERQRDIIYAKYKDNKTLEQIGDNMSVSRSRVGQLQSKAFNSLRNNDKIKDIAGIYGLDGYKAYHSGLSAFKNKGFSNVEEIAIERVLISNRK